MRLNLLRPFYIDAVILPTQFNNYWALVTYTLITSLSGHLSLSIDKYRRVLNSGAWLAGFPNAPNETTSVERSSRPIRR